MEEKLLTVAEVAKKLRLTSASVTRYLRTEELRGIKLDRVWRVREKDLEDFMNERVNK